MQCITTSPSALILADDCARAHYYHYTQKLRRIGLKRNPTLASGTAVAEVSERWIRNCPGMIPDYDALIPLVRASLLAQFQQDEDPKVNADKFTPGVLRALQRLPDWLWTAEWYSEEPLEATFSDGDLDVVVRGRPDLFRFHETGGIPTCSIVEIKTTDAAPSEYLLWVPQIRIYAAMLQQKCPDYLIAYQYVCVPTAKTADVHLAAEMVFTAEAVERTRQDILLWARRLTSTDPRYSRRCTWCEYAPLCMARIAGADENGVRDELYQTTATRDAKRVDNPD